MDPKDYTTWDTFDQHPIFGTEKSQIDSWSHDPTCYDQLSSYGDFLPQWYVHVDSAPAMDEQIQAAERDLRNLAESCACVENTFGAITYELIIMNDFTVLVWIRHPTFSVNLYPNHFEDEPGILKLMIDSPDVEESEICCKSAEDVVETILRLTDESR